MSASKRRRVGDKEKRDSGPFLALPLSVVRSRALIDLSGSAVKLLLDLYEQYRGDNNGRLACPFSQMQKRGWAAEHTLQRAKRELLESGLICETRKGARPNKVAFYAVTWYALDWSPDLDMPAASFPRGAYRLKDPLPTLRLVDPGESLTAETAVAASA